jgi:hypothetical protein
LILSESALIIGIRTVPLRDTNLATDVVREFALKMQPEDRRRYIIRSTAEEQIDGFSSRDQVIQIRGGGRPPRVLVTLLTDECSVCDTDIADIILQIYDPVSYVPQSMSADHPPDYIVDMIDIDGHEERLRLAVERATLVTPVN